ncbi:unnamed protein product [Allacma fusca]|uniref:Reverse transcriptase domain-containing protein n=1 Tax=Allacma fusca TaxID=39272 RepID=A0A8J2NNA7_9HEXA|nr:unnamed protein product [Allacma fusca]
MRKRKEARNVRSQPWSQAEEDNLLDVEVLLRQDIQCLHYGTQYTEADITKFVSFEFAKISFGSPRTVEAIRNHRRDPSYQRKLSARMDAILASTIAPLAVEEDLASVEFELDERIESVFQEMLEGSQDDQPSRKYLEEWLDRIVREGDPETALDSLNEYVLFLFTRIPGRKASGDGSGRNVVPQEKLGRSQRRRQEFKRMQQLYKTSRRKAAGLILDGVDMSARCELVPNFALDWAKTYERNPVPPDLSQMTRVRATSETSVWTPVLEEEIEEFLQADKAPGPDGITKPFLVDVGPRILSKIFSIIMRVRKLPDCLMSSHTIFIPKVKIAAKVGAGNGNGHAETCIRLARKRYRDLYVILLDMRNAFGSVPHLSMIRALEMSGASSGLVEYILRQLGDDYGFPVGAGNRVTAQAFADDMNCVSSTRSGLQTNIDKLHQLAACFGLDFNPNKCQTLSIRACGKNKFSWVEAGNPFYVGNVAVPQIRMFETFRYLGGFLDHQGLKETRVALSDWNGRLERCSLKPQQKLYILKMYLLPRLVLKLTFVKATDGNLRMFDKSIRSAARRMLNLPTTGVLNACFYAPVREGGLGLMRLRYSIPAIIARRFRKLRESAVPEIQWVARSLFNTKRIENAEKLIQSRVMGRDKKGRAIEVRGTMAHLIQKINAFDLHRRYTGRGLRESAKVKYVHNWVSDGSRIMESRKYCEALKLRFHALPLLDRLVNGLPTQRAQCRLGCISIESQGHVLQKCPWMRSVRVKRHDRVKLECIKILKNLNYEVRCEPLVRVGARCYKPDAVVWRDDAITVLEVCVVGDKYQLNTARRYKQRKYGRVKGMRAALRSLMGMRARTVSFCPVVISSKGIWAKRSEIDLLALGFKKKQLEFLTTLAVEGSVNIYRRFMRQVQAQ